MERYILSALTENHPGVLSRVSGLFSRRGYNIDSLTVGVTNDPMVSRMTIAVKGDKFIIEQIKNQLEKLIDVIEVIQLIPGQSVFRELALIKVSADEETRPSIISIVDIFRAKIIDVSLSSVTVEITGDEDKLESFIELMKPMGIKEIVRTGLTALERGNTKITDHKNNEEE